MAVQTCSSSVKRMGVVAGSEERAAGVRGVEKRPPAGGASDAELNRGPTDVVAGAVTEAEQSTLLTRTDLRFFFAFLAILRSK